MQVPWEPGPHHGLAALHQHQGWAQMYTRPSVNTCWVAALRKWVRAGIPRAEAPTSQLSHLWGLLKKGYIQITCSWWELVRGGTKKNEKCWIVLGKPKFVPLHKRWQIWKATISSMYLNSWTRCAVILDPDPPNGWPKAMAPPFTLVLLRSRSKLFSTAKYWGAKASFTLKQSKH